MAKQISIEISDDTDGSRADQTVPFGLDGVTFEIDLSNANASALRTAMEPYLKAARRTGGRRIKVAVGQSPDSNKTDTDATPEYTATHEMRAWARYNGHDVADRGRIPASIVEAYKASHKASKLGNDGKVRPASKSWPTSKRRK
ncbi:Lsr2 family protein [Amycolatopsis sp. SID8362]|uniref:histone-like nucleoid-structuring protein Lsr2 n=1 Tax=Amycolatopsis sp. SID8362 TaxID=2690346 RepID=UPI00136A5BE2|nr:Lsr2 family protein [Amycolatopsis sp. SID8362]NBH07402.1 Lsr2 family protein [Amycolatopsis sp. SID8362]NED44098.1 Lsr2 family protein [Amycolatopsis sp. SID8362]